MRKMKTDKIFLKRKSTKCGKLNVKHDLVEEKEKSK